MAVSILKAIVQSLNSINPSGRASIMLDGPAGRLILPVVPAELPKVSNPQNNETFSSVLGDLRIIGTMGLRTVTLDANTSAGEAAGYASDASTAATNAASSETNAHNSEIAAASSESNASTSETNAAASAAAAALAITPTGSVLAFAGSTSPAGWLLCDGSAVSRETYADLFAVIGTTYGSGDGSTTFNLPNLADKFIQGNAVSGTVKSAGLPNITGSVNNRAWISSGGSVGGIFTSYNGALLSGGTGSTIGSIASAASNTSNILEFDASQSNSIYGNSTTVQPPAVTMRYIIKC